MLELKQNAYYKIILTGKRNFEIDEKQILDLISNNIIRIKNQTTIKYDIEEISHQISLKGIFAKKIQEKIEQLDSEEEGKKLLEAFEIGMDILGQ
jgi:hypothetical protein